MRVIRSRRLTPGGITPTALAAAQLIAATGWTLLALARHLGAVPDFAPGPWAALAILVIFGTGLAYIINYGIIRNEGPTRLRRHLPRPHRLGSPRCRSSLRAPQSQPTHRHSNLRRIPSRSDSSHEVDRSHCRLIFALSIPHHN
jgi:hypothetical protein